MGKFSGILIASDLDGTLLRHDKSISPENTRALDYFMSEGGLFTVITGRMPYALSRVLDKVRINAPCGCGNGLVIYDTFKKERLWSMCVGDKALDIARYVEKKYPLMGIEITTHEKILCVRTNSYVEKHLEDENLEYFETTLDTFKGEMAKVLFADKPERLEVMIKELEKSDFANHLQLLRSDIPYYEILPRGTGKGNLLVKLAEILSLPIKNTIAVGDNDNDESMLRAAGIGIAVANASDIAKNASDMTTVSNEEHALAKIISDIEAGIIKVG